MARQTSRSKYLKLSISKTFKGTPIHPHPVRIQLGYSIGVIATVVTENIGNCQISISYPQVFLELQNEPSIITLTSNLLRCERDVRWTIKASKLTSVPFWISIRAIANKLAQETGFNVEVINNE